MASYSQYYSPLLTASFALCSVFKKLNSGVSTWIWTKFKGKLRLQTQISMRVKQLVEVSEADKAKAV